jgi:hypothetical protein
MSPSLFRYAAAALPGMGHVLAGRRGRGVCVLLAVAALIAVSLLLYRSTIGPVAYALAAAAHAYSILDLIPWRLRSLAAAALQPLMLLFYWPVLALLLDVFSDPLASRTAPTAASQLLTAISLFAASIGLSTQRH